MVIYLRNKPFLQTRKIPFEDICFGSTHNILFPVETLYDIIIFHYAGKYHIIHLDTFPQLLKLIVLIVQNIIPIKHA